MKLTKYIRKNPKFQPATIHSLGAEEFTLAVGGSIRKDDLSIGSKPMRAIVVAACINTAFGFAIAPAQAASLVITRPGTECVELKDTSPEIYYSGGNAANNAAGQNTFICPASTQYLALDGLGDFSFDRARWDVVVHDRHPTSNVTCYFRSCNQTGTSCINSPSRSSSNTGIHTLSMTSSFNWGDAYHYVYLRCNVPGKWNGARSSVKSYTTHLSD